MSSPIKSSPALGWTRRPHKSLQTREVPSDLSYPMCSHSSGCQGNPFASENPSNPLRPTARLREVQGAGLIPGRKGSRDRKIWNRGSRQLEPAAGCAGIETRGSKRVETNPPEQRLQLLHGGERARRGRCFPACLKEDNANSPRSIPAPRPASLGGCAQPGVSLGCLLTAAC